MIALALVLARRLLAAPLGGADAPVGWTARGVGIDPDRWRDSVDWPATATTGGLPADRLRCNIARADAVAGKAAHTLSTGRDAARQHAGACLGERTGIFWRWAQGRYCSRRSSLGAKRQLRTEASLLRCSSCLRPSVRTSTTVPPVTDAGHCWPAKWHRLHRDPLAAPLARLRRKTGTLIRRS